MKLICKLFNFLLTLFVNTVEGVAFALKTVGEVALDLLGSALDSVGDLLGVSGTTIAWLGAGLLLFFLLRKEKGDDQRDAQGGNNDEQHNEQRIGNQQVTG